MADKKISQLNTATTVFDADDFTIVQDGETKQANASTVKAYAKDGLSKSDVGLGNVDNTSDLNKPVSTATQTALNGKENADATILKSAAIGVSVQAYDADLTAWAGKTAPTGDAVGTSDSQTLTNKTISGATNTLSNIGNASLTNSSITINGNAVSLGGSTTVSAATTNTLTIGTGLSGTSFNGSSAVTIAIDSSVVTLTGTQTLTNKTLTSPTINGGTANNVAIGGTTPSAGNFTTLGATGDVTLGDAAGDTLTINAGTTNFAGTGQRITGDFSNATAANRLMFQTSTVNGNTLISAIPNGTATNSFLSLYNNSNSTNASRITIVCRATTTEITSTFDGTGTYLPILFSTGGREAMRIGATAGSDLSSLGIGYTSLSGVGEYGLAVSGKVGIGTSSPSNLLTVNSTTTSVPSAMRLARGSASIDAPSSYAAGDYALFSLAQNNASPSSGVAAFVRYLDIVANGAAGSADSLIRFFTNTSANAALERMRIDSSGNVGIGTSLPIYPLDIMGNAGAFGWNIRGRALDGISAARFANNSNTETVRLVAFADGTFTISNTASVTERLRIDYAGNVIVGGTVSPSGAGNIVCESATGKVGYGTGAGGTVTQVTSKSTAVTLNKPCGQIIMNNSALAAGASVIFVLNNTLITINDIVVVSGIFGAVYAGNYRIELVTVFSNACDIRVTNISGGSLSEAVAFNFAIIKGAIS